MRWLLFFLFLRESRVILPSVCIVIVLGAFCLFIFSLSPVMFLLLPFALLDYLSISREVCVSFVVLIFSVYIQGVTGGTDQTSGGCSLC